MGVIIRLVMTVTQAIKGAGAVTMGQCLPDLAKSGLAAVPVPALEPSDSDHTRDVLGQRDANSSIDITQLGEALVCAAGGRIDITWIDTNCIWSRLLRLVLPSILDCTCKKSKLFISTVCLAQFFSRKADTM